MSVLKHTGAASLLIASLLAWPCRTAIGQSESFDKPPPPDKDLLAKIEALPDNTWMKLPAFKTAGDLSWLKPNSDYRRLGPMVHDYCNRMVWAPERTPFTAAPGTTFI